MTKRFMGLLVLSLLILALVTGAAFAQQRTKVTVWLIGEEETGSYGAVWKHIKERIEEDLPHIEVDMQFGVSPDQRYTVAYAAGIAPDVVTLSTATAPQFINSGMVSPLDFEVFGVKDANEFRSIFYAGALKSMYVEDEIYFMPVEVTTFGMYYNKDMMEEAGIGADQVPATWDEIIELGKKFMVPTADGSSFDRVGLAMNRGWIWPSFRWVALLRQAGTDWIVDGRPQFDSPEGIRAMEMYTSLFHDNQVTIPTTGQAAFVNKRAPFYLGPSYEMRTLPELANFEFGTAAYPAMDLNNRVSTSYAWGLFVSSTSQVKKEAWEVIDYLTSERWAPTWFATSALLIPRDGDWIMDVIADQPLLAPFIMELEVAQLEMFHEEYAQIRSLMTTMDNNMVNRTNSVQNILADFNNQVEAIIGSN